MAVLGGTPRAHAGDPRLEWYTVENSHVRVHFHGGLEPLAQRTAAIAEQMQARLSRWLGQAPRDTLEILLTDSSDYANGFAGALPYSAIRLFVTAPDDMSVLGDYDDWLPTLLAHEQTHIVHINNISGLPALFNAVVGKQVAPSQLQPRWLIEGLAVYAETESSSGGRLRAPAFEMMLRADVVDDNFATLDQITGDPKRWPGGTIVYLYGAKFVAYLAETYGAGLFGQVVTDAGDNVMPFAVSRPFYRATGRTIEELYDGFRRTEERRVAELLAKVEARGLREGVRLTDHGRSVAHPRFFPHNCRALPESPASAAKYTLLYARDDGHERGGYYELTFAALERDHPNPKTSRQWVRPRILPEVLMTRGSGDTSAISRDCDVYFDSVAPTARRYGFLDLFRQAAFTRSPSGTESTRQRLTVGRRAAHPDVSPDGRSLVYVTNRAGTTTLRISQLDANHEIVSERALVPGVAGEQVFTPRFSHDGKRVVYATWSRGGYRDLRMVDLSTGKVTELWRDRATDQQPVFSPDDRRIYFSSDRSGIPNIYAYDLATQRLTQVTHVRVGAFMPEPSPDGKSLVYVGYGTKGYDLWAIPVDPENELAPEQAPIERGDRPLLEPQETLSGKLPVRRYSPLGTLRPRALGIDYRSDATGQRLILSAAGSDIVGHHGIAMNAVFEPEGNSPDVYLNYDYGRLPIGFSASAYRTSDPNLHYDYGTASARYVEVRLGASTGVSFGIPSEFSSQSVSMSYAAEQVSSELPTGTAADPYATVPGDPVRGISSSLRLAYSFSNTEGTHFGVGNERGMSFRLGVSEAHRGLGSELEGTQVSARTTGYIKMPWGRHHVLALANYLGAGTGRAASGFAIGGYQDSELIRSAIDGIGQSRMTLRGYPSGRFRGSKLILGQAEYRMPLWDLDRGVSTLPIFLRSIHGSVGFDAGGAFDRYTPEEFDQLFHYSWSGELWFDWVLSYRMSTRLLVGYSVGMGVGAIEGGTGYFVIGSGL